MTLVGNYDSHPFSFFDRVASISFPLGTEENYGAIVRGRSGISDYEAGLSNFIRHNLTAEHLFFDIGAQIGLFSVLACTVGAKCVSLEMRSSLVKAHYATKKANGFRDWLPLNFAIDESVGVIPYDDNAQFPLIPGVSDRKPSNSVLSVPLDALSDFTSFAKKVMIKVDVEGFEVRALRGMGETIKRTRPILCVECHPHAAWAFGDHISGVGNLLPSDYDLYLLRDHRDGYGIEITKISTIETFSDNFLVFCVPREETLNGVEFSS